MPVAGSHSCRPGPCITSARESGLLTRPTSAERHIPGDAISTGKGTKHPRHGRSLLAQDPLGGGRPFLRSRSKSGEISSS